MTEPVRIVTKKEPSGGELYKKTPEEREALKKAKAEHKKLMKQNGRKA